MRKVVIFGATSAIAQAAARLWANDGDELLLIARNSNRLQVLKKDLEVRGAARVECLVSDLGDLGAQRELFAKITACLPEYDLALIAYGQLSDQIECQNNFELARSEIRVNFVSVVALLMELARHFEHLRGGTIAVITSVAGDRGRAVNYTYGAAKAGLSVYLEGLRARLYSSGVNVLTIKPGFVDTPMTAKIKKGPLVAQPETVGLGIYRAVARRRDVVYLPWFWLGIMEVLKLIPAFIFKRLKF